MWVHWLWTDLRVLTNVWRLWPSLFCSSYYYLISSWFAATFTLPFSPRYGSASNVAHNLEREGLVKLSEHTKFQKLVTGDVPCMHTHQPHAADMCGEGLPACHPQIPSCENWV